MDYYFFPEQYVTFLVWDWPIDTNVIIRYHQPDSHSSFNIRNLSLKPFSEMCKGYVSVGNCLQCILNINDEYLLYLFLCNGWVTNAEPFKRDGFSEWSRSRCRSVVILGWKSEVLCPALLSASHWSMISSSGCSLAQQLTQAGHEAVVGELWSHKSLISMFFWN